MEKGKKVNADKAERASISDLVEEMQKKYSTQGCTIMIAENYRQLSRTSTGIVALDYIIGGGFVDGSIVDIYGPKGCGKLTIALHVIAAAQAAGKQCAFIDVAEGIGKQCESNNVEHNFDPFYAEVIGVDTDKLVCATPSSGEMAFDMTEKFILSRLINLIVIDSVDALVPKEALNGYGYNSDNLNSDRAKLINRAMRKLVGCAKDVGCTIIFINSIRKTGNVTSYDYESIGGHGLKDFSTISMEVHKTFTEMEVHHVQVKTVKNKTFPPFKTAEFDIITGLGIDNTGSIVDYAVNYGLINKSDNGDYSYRDFNVQNRSRMIDDLNSEDGVDTLKNLEEAVRKMLLKDSVEK